MRLAPEELRALYLEMGSPTLYRLGTLLPPEELRPSFLVLFSELSAIASGKSRGTAVYGWDREGSTVEERVHEENRAQLLMQRPLLLVRGVSLQLKEGGELAPTTSLRGVFPWGLHFSFPSLYYDPLLERTERSGGANKELFRHLREWARKNTSLARVAVDGRIKLATCRVGKGSILEANSAFADVGL